MRKGIILAGGSGTRLHPLTLAVSKQLLPIYDKPMIYYPLSTLMLAGVREVLIITTPESHESFKSLLGTGAQWGLELSYAQQETPRGLADAYLIGEKFLDGAPSAMILGDNMFFGHGLGDLLVKADGRDGATVFCSHVGDPGQFGVVEFDADKKVVSLEEKPQEPKSNWAVTGLYFLDARAPEMARRVVPSARGELEILSILEQYQQAGQLAVETLYRGFAWLDAGTHSSLSQACEFVKALQERQGLLVCAPDEIAYREGLIRLDQLHKNADSLVKSSYGQALMTLVGQERKNF